MTHFKTDWA